MTELRIVRAGLVPYEEARARQGELHAQVVAGDAPDTVLLLEHPSVYTAGKRTEPHERPFDGTPVIDVDRGGKITWHGPGQLVGYPIVRLPDPVDVVAYVRRLESMLIDVCAEFGVTAGRVEGRSGAWVSGTPDRKLGQIGIRVAKGVTLHGFALNCDPDMSFFANMVPCGIPDAAVTSLTNEVGRDVTVAEVLPPGRAAPAGRPRAAYRGTVTAVQPQPDGRRMLRIEQRNTQTPIERKPEWIKTRAKMGPEYTELKSLVAREGLHTVCQAAGCPNIYECWEDREATFLIGGDQCTRRCDFCQIDTGKPQALDRDEPRRVAESVRTMQLRYATITGVARDDLVDGGAWLYAETVRKIHELNPGTGVENLIPDFNGVPELLQQVFESRPEVLAHNVETVPRIFKSIRPGFRYERSLDVIRQARAFGLVTKSNLILGMGETRDEISDALAQMHDAGCELVTITQYLRPSPKHHPVERWVKPPEFVELQEEAEEIGFAGVLSGPLVRSSYRAGRLYTQAIAARTA